MCGKWMYSQFILSSALLWNWLSSLASFIHCNSEQVLKAFIIIIIIIKTN
jgi:hypothetical protein